MTELKSRCKPCSLFGMQGDIITNKPTAGLVKNVHLWVWLAHWLGLICRVFIGVTVNRYLEIWLCFLSLLQIFFFFVALSKSLQTSDSFVFSAWDSASEGGLCLKIIESCAYVASAPACPLSKLRPFGAAALAANEKKKKKKEFLVICLLQYTWDFTCM